MSSAEERLLQERFRALAGPADGDWNEVRRRGRRRVGRAAAVALTVALALAAAGLAVGGDVVGLFAEHGKRVPLSSFTPRDRQLLLESLCKRLAFSRRAVREPEVVCRDGSPTVEEIANDGARIHWRVRYPWGLTCLASGRAGGYQDPNRGDSKIGSLACNAGASERKLVPTPKRPITVELVGGADRNHPSMRLLRISGLAGSGIEKVELVASNGATLSTSVRGHAYSFRQIPDREWSSIVALDASGTEVYREPLLGGQPPPRRPPAPSTSHRFPVPARPSTPPLQHAATRAASVDVYRNGVVAVAFTTPSGEAYRRLARSEQRSGNIIAGCGTVAFGGGRWRDLGGGSTAYLAPEVRMRIDREYGGMPSPPFDYCEVGGTYGRYWNDEEGPREVVEVPFTAIGRRYLDERATARGLAYFVRTRKLRRVRLAIHRGEPGPSARRLAQIFGERIVPLASRDGTAPTGRVGVWTDGKLIVATEQTAGGRRLYVTVRGVFIGATNIRDLAFPF